MSVTWLEFVELSDQVNAAARKHFLEQAKFMIIATEQPEWALFVGGKLHILVPEPLLNGSRDDLAIAMVEALVRYNAIPEFDVSDLLEELGV